MQTGFPSNEHDFLGKHTAPITSRCAGLSGRRIHNRDEKQFENADGLDLEREPNPHVAFGVGIHYCLGASLARLEGQIAIATLLRTIPNLRLAVPSNALRWRRGLVLRGLESLPVTIT